jgi:glycosyltransferase involved in cell wall biosynthesis
MIVLSSKTIDYITAFYTKDIRFHVLDNTIDESFVKKIENNKKYNSQVTHFVFISNYIEDKGILLLLETFKYLDDCYRLTCYGNFTNTELKTKILSYSSKNILINGPIVDKNKFSVLGNSDALILPSFVEGKPLIVLEAMSMGIPVIVPDIGYIKEMLFDDYPLMYGDNNSLNLLASINKFKEFTEFERIGLREGCKMHYWKNFSNSVHCVNLLDVFKS